MEQVEKRSHVVAPRIEVVLVPADGRYEAWLVLHVPDGKDPKTVRIGRDTYDREAAVKLLLDVYTKVGEDFCFDGTAEGSSGKH